MDVALWPALMFVPVVVVLWALAARRRPPAVVIPVVEPLLKAHRTPRLEAARWLPVLRLLALVLLVAAVARPRVGHADARLDAEGVDLVVALDISSSMERGTLSGAANRLDAARAVLDEFIAARDEDRVGIVVFAENALPYAPLSLDHGALREIVRSIEAGIIADGTAIGDGIATSLNMLRNSNAAGRAVILLTDGVHNVDSISPLDAATLAQALRVPVYTVGVVDPAARSVSLVRDIDVELLQEVAEVTGGRYFEATSQDALANIYAEIGGLERSKVAGQTYARYTEFGPWLLAVASTLLVADLLLRGTWLRRTP